MFKNIIGLFLPDSTDFPQNGTMASFRACPGFLGTLPDCIEPRVVEELNGAFEFTFQYPCDGVLFPNIQHGSIVVTMPRRWVSQGGVKPQAFRVYEITTPLNGIVTVNCQHVSYDMASAMLFNYDQDVEHEVEDPTTGETHKEITRYKTDTSQLFTRINSDGTDAPGIFGIDVDGVWHPGILDKNTFPNGLYKVRAKRKIQPTDTASSSNDDPPPTGWAADADFTFKIDQPTTLRAIMCDDDEEGITKALKGFWTFDNWNAMLDTVRGKEIDPQHFSIEYKVNMTEMKSTVNCPLHYTHVYPYYKDGNTFLTYSIPTGEVTKAPEDETANLVPIYNDAHPDPYLYHASTRFEVDERPKVILPLDLTDKIKAMMKTGYDSITGIQLTKLFNLGSLLATNVRTLWSAASSKNDGKKITLSWTADPTGWPNGAYISKRLVTVADPRLMIRSLQNPVTNTGFSSQTVNAANAILEMMPEGSVIFLMKGTKYLSYYSPKSAEITISEIETSGFYQKVGASMILRDFDGYCEFDSGGFATRYDWAPYAASFTLIQENHYNLGTMVDDVIDSDFEEEYPENAYDLAKMTVGDACLPSEHWDTETVDSVMEIIGKPYEDIGDPDFALEYPDVRSYIRSVAGAMAQNGYDTLEHGSAWIFQHTAVTPGSTESQIQECLRQLTDEYIEREFLNGIPKDISVSFYDDGEQSIEPGDIVTVYNSELIGSSGYKTAIVKIEYDPAADVYTGIEYGDLEEIEGLSATIDKLDGDKHGNVVGHESSAVSEVKTIIEKTSGIYDGYVKIGRDLDDPDNASYENPNELMVVDNTDLTKAKNMWRWDSKGLISYRKNPNYTEPDPWNSQNEYAKGDVVVNGKYYYEARKDISADTAWSDSNWKRIKVPRNKWVATTAISIDGTINAELIKAGTIQGVDIIAKGSTVEDNKTIDHSVSILAGTGQMILENSTIESYDNKVLFKHVVYGKSTLTSPPPFGTTYESIPDDDTTTPIWHGVQDEDDTLACYTWDDDDPDWTGFSEHSEYHKNDIVEYDNVLYIALRDMAAGPWDIRKWALYGTRPVWVGPYDILDSSAQYKYNTTFRLDPKGNAYFAGNVQGGEIHIGEVYDEYVGVTVPAFNVSPDGDVISYGNMKLAGTVEWGAGVSPTQTLYAAGSTAPTKPTAGSRWDSYPETSTTGWHRTWSSNDVFASYTWDGGNTWTEGIIVKGTPGRDGQDGKDGRDGQDGAPGKDAVIYTIEAPDTLFHVDKNGTITPTSITCTSYKTVGRVKSAFTGYMEVVSGGTTVCSRSASTITIYGTDFASSNIAVITLYESSSKTTILASHTIGRIVDGADGGQGEPGVPGPAGDDGVSYTINATSLTFHKINGVINPSSITCTAYKTLGGNAPSAYSGWWKVECGSMTPITYSNTNTIAIANGIFDNEGSGTIVRVSLYSEAAHTNLLYTISLTLLTDGRDGVNEYIHVAYAPAEPTSTSSIVHQTPQTGDTYIGTYTGTKPQWDDVNWVTEAQWAYFKGEPGDPAEVTMWNTFNALTDNGRTQGIFYDPPLVEGEDPDPNVQLYINASAIKAYTGEIDYLLTREIIGKMNNVQGGDLPAGVHDYNSSANYSIGDLVTYGSVGSKRLYRAKENNITGAWNSLKWDDLGLVDDTYLNIYSDHIIMHGTVYFAPGHYLEDEGITVISGDDIKTGTISANRIDVPSIAGTVEQGLTLNSYPPQALTPTGHGGLTSVDSEGWVRFITGLSGTQNGSATYSIPNDCNMIYVDTYSNGVERTNYLTVNKGPSPSDVIRSYINTPPSTVIYENAISVTPGSTITLGMIFAGGTTGGYNGGLQVRTTSRNSSVIQLRGTTGLISAAEINIVGMVKFTDLLETGTTTINGANIITGSIKADKIDATNLHVKAANIDDTLTAAQIDATNLHVKAGNIDELIIADQLTLLDGSKFDIQTPASFGQLSAKAISVEGRIDTRQGVHANSLWLNDRTITSGSVGGTVRTERYKVTCTAVSGSSNKFKVKLKRTTTGYYNYSDSLTFNFYYKIIADGPIKGYVSKSVQFNIPASETAGAYDEHEIELAPERSPLLMIYRYTFVSVVGTDTIASDGTFEHSARSGSPEKVIISNSSLCGIDTSSIAEYSPFLTYMKGDLVKHIDNKIYQCNVDYTKNVSPGTIGSTWIYRDNASSILSWYNLGSAYLRWNNIFLRHDPEVSSDANIKHDIDAIDDKYDVMFDNLRPTQFMYNGGDRIHLGLIAQEVEEAMQAAGIDNTEFGGLCKDSTDDGDIYGLRYGEFIGLLIKEVQTLKKRVNQLEQGENENEGNETESEPESDTAEETLGTEIQ